MNTIWTLACMCTRTMVMVGKCMFCRERDRRAGFGGNENGKGKWVKERRQAGKQAGGGDRGDDWQRVVRTPRSNSLFLPMYDRGLSCVYIRVHVSIYTIHWATIGRWIYSRHIIYIVVYMWMVVWVWTIYHWHQTHTHNHEDDDDNEHGGSSSNGNNSIIQHQHHRRRRRQTAAATNGNEYDQRE